MYSISIQINNVLSDFKLFTAYILLKTLQKYIYIYIYIYINSAIKIIVTNIFLCHNFNTIDPEISAAKIACRSGGKIIIAK